MPGRTNGCHDDRTTPIPTASGPHAPDHGAQREPMDLTDPAGAAFQPGCLMRWEANARIFGPYTTAE